MLFLVEHLRNNNYFYDPEYEDIFQIKDSELRRFKKEMRADNGDEYLTYAEDDACTPDVLEGLCQYVHLNRAALGTPSPKAHLIISAVTIGENDSIEYAGTLYVPHGAVEVVSNMEACSALRKTGAYENVGWDIPEGSVGKYTVAVTGLSVLNYTCAKMVRVRCTVGAQRKKAFFVATAPFVYTDGLTISDNKKVSMFDNLSFGSTQMTFWDLRSVLTKNGVCDGYMK